MTLAGLREPAGIFAISLSIFQGNCYKLLHFCRSTLQTQCSRQVTRIMKLFVLTSKYFPKITTVSCKFHLHFLSEMMSVDCRSKISSYLIVAEDARRLQANLLRLNLKQCLLPICLCPKWRSLILSVFLLWHVQYEGYGPIEAGDRAAVTAGSVAAGQSILLYHVAL